MFDTLASSLLVQENGRLHRENCALRERQEMMATRIKSLQASMEVMLVDLGQLSTLAEPASQHFLTKGKSCVKVPEVPPLTDNYGDANVKIRTPEIAETDDLDSLDNEQNYIELDKDDDFDWEIDEIDNENSLRNDNAKEDLTQDPLEEVGESLEYKALEQSFEDGNSESQTKLSVHSTMHEQQPVHVEKKARLIADSIVNDHQLLKCLRCDYTAESMEEKYQHTRQHDTPSIFFCHYCSVSKDNMANLDCHIKYNHEEQRMKDKVCEACGFVTKKWAAYYAHKIKCEKSVFLHCDDCEYKSRSKSAVYHHRRRLHVIRKVKCSLCDYEAKNDYEMKKHRKAMHAEERLYCDQCSYSSSRRTNFQSHMEQHIAGGARHQCHICPATLASAHNLGCHIRKRHTARKAKQCPHCDYKCLEAVSLRVHMEKHNGVTICCQRCSYTTLSSTLLQRHVKKVHAAAC